MTKGFAGSPLHATCIINLGMDFGIVGMIFDGLTKILMGNLKSIEQTETYLHEV